MVNVRAGRLALALCVALLAATAALAKNEMHVDERRVRTNDTVTITILLEGPYAAIDEPRVPLRNLRMLGNPSVSSEFAWINGDVSRRKTFRFLVRPLAPGEAVVGPLVLNASDGQRDTLGAVTLQVEPDRVSGSNDAEVVLRELVAAGRPPMFVVAEVEKTAAYVGEPIAVTWYLYNAASIQEWAVVSVPKLPEFWIEELARGESAERMYLGDTMVQRLPVRRAVLFPLRPGRVSVEGMTVEASLLERRRGGPFAMFEGSMVQTTFTSASFTVDVRPLPPGAPVAAVGDLALRCEPPVQRNAGPVLLRATLEGVGNLRAASAPEFEGVLAGTVQREAGEVSVSRDDGALAMSRRWQYLIFPRNAGSMRIPPLRMRVFVPETGERRELQCGASTLEVRAAQAETPAPAAAAESPERETPARWPWIAGALALVAIAMMILNRVQAELRLRKQVQTILDAPSPEAMRALLAGRLRIDPREASDRGDAYRAVLSVLDAMERERDLGVDAEQELRARLRELLR